MIFRVSTKSISAIQLAAMFGAVIGAFLVSWTWWWALLALILFYVYGAAGISMMYHRYWTHKSFEFKYDWMKWPFTLLACLVGKGSPLAWVYIHRLHHANADTEKDPHSPHFGGFRLMGFKSISYDKLKIFLIRDIATKPHRFLHDYYLAIFLVWAIGLFLISPALFYFAWVLPVAVLQVAQDLFNYFAHVSGYRTFATKDTSTNCPWLFPLILGEAWHNNHHNSPKSARFGLKKWEFDPVMILINLLKK